MRKITSICISIIIIFTLSVSALANTNTPLTNYGESNPYETIINIDESGNPIIIKNNENDSEQQRRVAGVALVWSIKSIGNNTYEFIVQQHALATTCKQLVLIQLKSKIIVQKRIF